MTQQKIIDALTIYVNDCHAQRRREKETESSFTTTLFSTNDLQELNNMWQGSFTSTPQRREHIENKIREVIAGVTPDNIPDGFQYFVCHPDLIAPPIRKAFNQKAEGLLEALEEPETAQT